MMKKFFILATLTLSVSLAMGDLAAYWPLNEGSGTTAQDESPNGKDGAFYSANGSNYPQWITGHDGTGYALQFNAGSTSSANSNCLVVDANTIAFDPNDPNTPGLGNLTEVFTIAMWVRRDALDYLNNLWPRIVHTGVYDVQLAFNPDGSTGSADPYDYFGWPDTTSYNRPGMAIGTETAAQKTLGNWYHMAVVSDGVNIRKYINGVQEASLSVPNSDIPFTTGSLRLGSKLDNTSYFTGALDDVAVWAGSYLPAEEIVKLANGTATPLTVVDSGGLEPVNYILETPLYPGGWPAVWDPDMNWSMSIVDNHVVYNGYWHFYEPNSRDDIVPDKWYVMDETTYYKYNEGDLDISMFGVEWIDQSWNGRDPDMAVMAAYITPGLVFGQKDWDWYPKYTTTGGLPYFKTNVRIASVNSDGASARVTVYTLSSDVLPDPNNHSTLMTHLGEVVLPLDAGDHVWQYYAITLPMPQSSTRIPLWFEMAIVGGNANTVLYIDHFKPVAGISVTFRATDLNEDSYIGNPDIDVLAYNWLDSTNAAILDPRSGGLLTNGDFSADLSHVLTPGGIVTPGSSKVMNPTGWTFSGTGDYGIWNSSQRGRTGWYYDHPMNNPVGGNVSAYTTDMFPGDPNGVLSQTASEPIVSGQTYYAMGYVMAHKYISNNDLGEWYGWRDTATMEIAVDGVVKATVSRPLSRSIWRPLYASYTAVGADAGKSISIRFSYANTNTAAYTQASNMNIGYAYLGTTVPNEWPEKRNNILTNGGFEDLSVIEGTSAYDRITGDDNGGAWFPNADVPVAIAPPGWLYEVPSGFFDPINDPNTAGIRASGYYSSPLPTPGLHDITMYTSEGLSLGQIVGALTPGTKYYLDTACGVLIEPQTWGRVTVTWPNPVPTLHVELWRIPAGVTDPATIHSGVTGPLSGYVKIANADVASPGDIKNINYKWQIIGTSYTATSADTNVYVRIYGTNAVTSPKATPSFAFSDVYLSTEKRLVAGGSLINSISAGVGYDVLGPYDCYQASLMGYTAPAMGDIDGDCTVNLADFALIASEWLEVGLAF